MDRLNTLLGVIRARLVGLDDYDAAARLLQTWLEARGGRVEADWRAPMDSWTVRSLDLAIEEAEVRRKGIQRERQAPGKAALYRRNQGEYEARRRELGLPPSPRGIPRQIRAKGSVAGKTVADFPWLTHEWHPTRNLPLQMSDVPAGSGMHVWWKCPRAPDHEWEAQVRSRTIRGVRCQFCTHRKLAPSESFGATHPDVAAEWHPTRNGRNLPSHFTFGSHHEAWWQCPLYKTHVYQARISSRTSMKSGCKRCGYLRRSKNPRRARRDVKTDTTAHARQAQARRGAGGIEEAGSPVRNWALTVSGPFPDSLLAPDAACVFHQAGPYAGSASLRLIGDQRVQTTRLPAAILPTVTTTGSLRPLNWKLTSKSGSASAFLSQNRYSVGRTSAVSSTCSPWGNSPAVTASS